jgi:choline dehydrogenase
VLGGSSCTNVCLHHRGSADDYNMWNIPGWYANDVLPFFKMSQKDVTGRDAEYHGKDGVWVMDDVKYQNPLSKRFLEVGQAAGMNVNDDFNSWKTPQDGIGRFQVSEYKGERVSGATAYLSNALQRTNLVVRTGMMVRKINFDTSQTANGVNYDRVGDDCSDVSGCIDIKFMC